MTTITVPTTVNELAGTWTLDASHSRVGFVARHAMITKVRGSFNDFEGQVVVPGELSDAAVSLTIQTASIDTRSEQRDGHLRSGDFLAIDEFPQITFTSTAVTPTGDDAFELTGDLTIKGVTKQVTVPFEFGGAAIDPFDNVRAGFEGSVTINRKDFGITWNAALETGGVLVSEKVNLEFEVSAIKTA